MIRHAEAQWNGSLKEGSGHVKVETGTLDTSYSFRSRFEGGKETNPEELLGASHAGCFSMALAAALTAAGHAPNRSAPRPRFTSTRPAAPGRLPKSSLKPQATFPAWMPRRFRSSPPTPRRTAPSPKPSPPWTFNSRPRLPLDASIPESLLIRSSRAAHPHPYR